MRWLGTTHRARKISVVLAFACASTSGHAVSQRRPSVKTERLVPRRIKMHASARLVLPRQRAATLGDIPTTNESLQDRLVNPLRWYDQQLRRSPIRTKSLSNGVVSALGDALAQTLTTGTIDKTRLFAWYLSGLFYFGPILHTWYNGLAWFDRHMREKHQTPKVFIVVMQIAFNQFVGSAVVNACFLYFLAFTKMAIASVFAGSAFAPLSAYLSATYQLHTSFVKMMLANWLFWPLPSAANLLLIPLPYRVLFSNTCSLVWKTILSMLLGPS